MMNPSLSPATLAIWRKGKPIPAPSVTIAGYTVVQEGRWLKTARLFDEVWQENLPSATPAQLAEAVRESGLQADIFTVAQAPQDTVRRHDHPVTYDNLAVADTRDFGAWWTALPQESRKNVRKAQKRGLALAPVDFTDDLVRGIKSIYDETPVRQGRRFWHYGKDLATVRRENSSYLERSQFIGAFLDGELVGFLKMVFSGPNARIMQILSRADQQSKHPTNALLVAAVDLCAQRGIERLIYGQYVYGSKRSGSITEFKRRNGFHEVLVPRYHVPLTWKGSLAVAAGFHRDLAERLPEPVVSFALRARAQALSRMASYRGLRPQPPVASNG